MDVPLPRAPFRVEGEVTDSIQTVNVPFGEGIRSADYGVARRI